MWRLNKNDTISGMKMATRKMPWEAAWALGGWGSHVPSASTSRASGSSRPPGCFSRYDSNSGGEREIQRTMLELLNQLDGFDSRGDVKVIMATNRIETLDPALIRPGHAAPALVESARRRGLQCQRALWGG